MGKNAKYRIGLVSLGCAKNRVDSEVILGMLGEKGFEVGMADETCDVIIVNTCAFIEDAKVEAVEEIMEALEIKKAKPGMRIYVTGCLPQRYPVEVGAEIRGLDGVYGVDEVEKLVSDIITDSQPTPDPERHPKLEVDTELRPVWLYTHEHPRLLTTAPHYAYLKISEGCDHKCAFCTIPGIRGPYRSREVSSVIAEVSNLARMGVKEVNLVSQDTTAFGTDTGSSLKRLLTELDKLDAPQWIRLLYMHPEKIDDELLSIIKGSNKILNYLDIPMQHCDGGILTRMHRTAPDRDYLDLVKHIREFFGDLDVCLRTTLITGFPGETDSEFERMGQFIMDAEFDRLSVFKFSRELGTEAWGMCDQVEDYEMDHRYHSLMNIQADVSFLRNSRYIGREMRVLVEDFDDDEEMLRGRSFRDAPEVDGMVYIIGDAPVGEFADVTIKEALEYDLVGEVR